MKKLIVLFLTFMSLSCGMQLSAQEPWKFGVCSMPFNDGKCLVMYNYYYRMNSDGIPEVMLGEQTVVSADGSDDKGCQDLVRNHREMIADMVVEYIIFNKDNFPNLKIGDCNSYQSVVRAFIPNCLTESIKIDKHKTVTYVCQTDKNPMCTYEYRYCWIYNKDKKPEAGLDIVYLRKLQESNPDQCTIKYTDPESHNSYQCFPWSCFTDMEKQMRMPDLKDVENTEADASWFGR